MIGKLKTKFYIENSNPSSFSTLKRKTVLAIVYCHVLNFTSVEDAIICKLKNILRVDIQERTLPLQEFSRPLIWFYRGRTSVVRTVAWSLLNFVHTKFRENPSGR